ncbi:MAG: carbamoyltransferase HypF [Acidimicrobiia bacterium]
MTGVVQGVGFRPFVYVLATGLGLTGHVGNDSAGVFIEVEGRPEVIEEFCRRLVEEAPPLARIESVTVTEGEASGRGGFEIVASVQVDGTLTLVSADMAPCRDCLAEMSDPADRRFRYPFLNCTNCGPRFTITRSVPYDRPATTMADFPMCDECLTEYRNPHDRRFHAQPTACPRCGPRLTAHPPRSGDPIESARAVVAADGVVAIKGVGGFHLACRADSDDAVAGLRRRKQRPDKPLAVMVADVATARQVAQVDAAEATLLEGIERPIVLCRTLSGSPLSDLVAPGNGFLGLMLPSTPLHHLLLKPGDLWVMTSGNRRDEPICIDNDEALERLGDLADLFLLHDRPIHVPCDDSVVRVHRNRLLPVRRSRGYAPYPVPLGFSGPPVLAVGGELKATACLTSGDHAFMSQHIGDMGNLETLQAFERAVEHMTSLFATEPAALACDAHPRYLSAQWARRVAGDRPVIEVQHHHAHLASLLAEHRHPGPFIGFSFDGTGYGADGTIWGGEVMVADLAGFERVGHLRPSQLAGGDAAVRSPARQALTRLREAGITWDQRLPPVSAGTEEELRILATQLDRGLNVTTTTSMGRLFDSVASLCGVRHLVSYEGQAAIELEALITDIRTGYTIPIDDDGVWDTAAVIGAVAADVLDGVTPALIASRFHVAVAETITRAALRVRTVTGLALVGLSGGVFQNVALTELAERSLMASGFEVLTHRLVPPNDGGIALGQAAVAATRLSTSSL